MISVFVQPFFSLLYAQWKWVGGSLLIFQVVFSNLHCLQLRNKKMVANKLIRVTPLMPKLQYLIWHGYFHILYSGLLSDVTLAKQRKEYILVWLRQFSARLMYCLFQVPHHPVIIPILIFFLSTKQKEWDHLSEQLLKW